MRRSHAAGLAPLVLLLSATVPAAAQRAEVSIESEAVYAGAPFVLTVTSEGFAESPEPTIAPFEIPGCTVTSLGASPSVSSSITIVNGRRRETRQVRFAHRFQVDCARAGTIKVPALALTQGGTRAATRPGEVEVRALAATDDMALRLGLPERPLSIGETFDVTIDWYLRKDPDDPNFAIPLFELPAFEVAPPTGTGGRALAFTIGGRPVELPYSREDATLDGAPFTRFRFTARVTPLASGRFELPAARVTARLPVGYGRDAFGFRVPRMGQFKAEDRPRTLEVAPLPTEGRPPSFAGAVGTGFSVEVRASHTVVRIGDPIELAITVRGDGHLEGLSLPDLAGPGGLPADDFDVPAGKPAGEIVEDGKAKRFSVTARLKRAVGQIPPIELAYWNPAARRYEVARSQAVALSAGSASTVGAGDVVGGSPRAGATGAPAAEGAVSVVGADLSPSAPQRTARHALTMTRVRPFVIGLYVLPTLLLAASLGLRRSRGRAAAGRRGQVALRSLDAALGAARGLPARDSVGAVTSALREVLRAADQPVRRADDLVAEVEHLGFDPKAAGVPLPEALIARLRAEAAGWLGAASGAVGSRGAVRGPGAALVLVVAAGLGLGATTAWAVSDGELATARAAYQAALAEPDRVARTRAFGHAEELYRALVLECADCPELVTDWGNAALGAGEPGRAALAFRRALALKPSLERAEKNLAWLRAQQPAWAAATDGGGAVEALVFWHHRLARPSKHAWAAACYALAILLITPLGRSRRRTGRGRRRRRAAVIPAVIAVAMLGSIAFERDTSDDAVVVADGVVLRAADSPGAPAAVAEPVPVGVEVSVLERRDGWHRVALHGGTTGWLPAGALEHVGDPAGG